jgi:hypothetical protein
MWRTGWIFAIVALAWFQLTPAKAYTVRSGFTGGCHEDVTLRLSRFLLDDPMVGFPIEISRSNSSSCSSV